MTRISTETAFINRHLSLSNNPGYNPNSRMLRWLEMYLRSSYRSGDRYFHYNSLEHGRLVNYSTETAQDDWIHGKFTRIVLYFENGDSYELIDISARAFKRYCRKNHMNLRDMFDTPLENPTVENIYRFTEFHKDCTSTTISGKFSYIITPSGRGSIQTIRCNACGDEVTISGLSN